MLELFFDKRHHNIDRVVFLCCHQCVVQSALEGEVRILCRKLHQWCLVAFLGVPFVVGEVDVVIVHVKRELVKIDAQSLHIVLVVDEVF